MALKPTQAYTKLTKEIQPELAELQTRLDALKNAFTVLAQNVTTLQSTSTETRNTIDALAAADPNDKVAQFYLAVKNGMVDEFGDLSTEINAIRTKINS